MQQIKTLSMWCIHTKHIHFIVGYHCKKKNTRKYITFQFLPQHFTINSVLLAISL